MEKEQRALNLAADLSAAISSDEFDLTPYMQGEPHEMTAKELREHVAGIVQTVRGFHDPSHYTEAPLPRIRLTFVTSIGRDWLEVFGPDSLISDEHNIASMVKLFREEWSHGKRVRRRGPAGEVRWMMTGEAGEER
jgi:hypothetical protein